MRIYLDSVRELIKVIIDELLVPVDKIVLGEVAPRELRYRASHIRNTEG